MIFLILDILFYSISNLKTCFVAIYFSKKFNIWEYFIVSILIILITRNYLYYAVLLSISYILNTYVYKRILANKLIILLLNFILFTNISLDLNYLLSFFLIVLFSTLGPYNVLGD